MSAKKVDGDGVDDAALEAARLVSKKMTFEAPPEQITPPDADAVASQRGVDLGDVEPIGWDNVAELLNCQGLGGDGIPLIVMEGAEQYLLDAFADAHGALDPDNYGVLSGATSNKCSALGRYILERNPTAEVLFTKARELGLYRGRALADLNTAERASLELAVRVGPAVKAALDAVLAEAAARHPPPPIPPAGRAVDIEDTIFEQVDGALDRF